MPSGYVRQSAGQIATSATIEASHFNNEFNSLRDAFNSTSGHDHSGATGTGAPINLTNAVTSQLPLANGGTGANLSDPGADALLGWDDSATANIFFSLGTGLTTSTTTISVSAPLASIAGLTTAADKMIYTTASNTYAVADLSSFARTILDDADAGTVRTTLGLGTLSTADDINNSNWSGTDLAVANGGTGASDASTARTNLGLAIGSNVQAYDADTAKLDVEQTWTQNQHYAEDTLTDAASIAWDVQSSPVAKVTLGGNRTLANPSNGTAGSTYLLRVIQDGTGSRTLAYGANYKFPGGTAPTASTGASDVDILTCYYDGTNMNCTLQKDFS